VRKGELVYNYILEQVMEGRKDMTQAEIASALKLSLSVVNAAIGNLKKMAAVRVRLRGFTVVDAKKILYYWASIRNVDKDIVYATRSDKPATEIEKEMPPGVVYASYSAYKIKFKDVPADYSEIYVYGNPDSVKKRFLPSKNKPNIFVLKEGPKKMTSANIFVDLWNMREWYAKDFLKAMEERIDGILA
jgi:hypothetical protein